MKRKRIRRRRFFEGEVHHIYQRTRNRFNIFYDIEDYIVYYTIFSIAARQYKIIVLGLCLMYDHIHMLIKTNDKVSMSEFVRQVTSMFAREQNNDVGRKGSLFEARFGSAPKRGNKLVRTAISYLFNNPVERYLCNRAEEYKWNFLAYAESDHAFSEPFKIIHASRDLQRALKEVNIAESEDRHLRYCQVKRLLQKLKYNEQMQLVDHIINKFNSIHYEESIRYYGSFENMLTAINSNTGSEYDIKEDRYKFPDTEYVQISEFLQNHEGIYQLRKVTSLDIESKVTLANLLKKYAVCSEAAIAKYLHIEMDT